MSTLVALAFYASAIELPQSQQSGPPPSSEEAPPPADDTVDPSVEEPTGGDAEEPAPEEEVEQVCHRRTEYDMMGKPRSRRVCRPR